MSYRIENKVYSILLRGYLRAGRSSWMTNRRIGLLVGLAGFTLGISSSAAAQQTKCSFPKGDKTSVGDMVTSIKKSRAACALPWRALKRAVSDPVGRQTLDAAYDDAARRYPERTTGIRARKADVAAAAGQPEQMLAIADANILAHPEDKTLPNMSCFARGRYGFDIEHAMPFCNAAVDAGRPGWSLVNRGRVELQLGLYREALADFNEALGDRNFRQHPMMVDAAHGRGIARLRLGDGGGETDIKTALAARPSVADDFEDAGIRP